MMLYNAVEVICKASKDWMCLTGSLDFSASLGTTAIFGPVKESAAVHVSKLKNINHVYNVISLGGESPEKKARQTVRCEM